MSSGCDRANTLAPPRDLSPPATSPAAAVRRLEWAFNNRNVDAISGLLTGDVVFRAAAADSAGSAVVQHWTREQLLASLQALLVGDQVAPAAARVQLNFDTNPSPFPDTRPGHSGAVHRSVRTSLEFTVATAEGDVLEAAGHLLCYVTRGDSAQIPSDEKARGAKSDSTLWWFDTLEDETIDQGFHTTPSHPTSFTDILRLYHDPSRH